MLYLSLPPCRAPLMCPSAPLPSTSRSCGHGYNRFQGGLLFVLLALGPIEVSFALW